MNLERLAKSVKNNLSHLSSSERDRKNLDIIIEAIHVIDRIFFVRDKADAYIDTALPIGYNQTISQPSTVARMLMLADLETGNNLLEVGAGSGWNASLAGYILYPGNVLSLDIVPQLVEKAHQNLDNLILSLNPEDRERLSHVEFRYGNIFKQLSSWQKKFQRIIITAGIKPSQEPMIQQLAEKVLDEKGILICPHMHGPLIILRMKDGKISKNTTLEQYVFVPLLE